MAYADSETLHILSSSEVFKNHKIIHTEMHHILQSYPSTKIISKNKALEVLFLPHHQRNIYLRFQLQAEYPEALPDISVTSDCLTKTETTNLQKLLTGKAKITKGQPMLGTLISEACQYLYKIDPSVAVSIDNEHSKTKHKPNKQLKKMKKEILNFTSVNERTNGKGKKGITISDLTEDEFPLQPSLNTDLSSVLSTAMKRPTHFIALRITDENLILNLIKVQNQLVNKEPLLAKGLFAKEIFHLTLISLGLDTESDILKCIEALDKMKSDLQEFLPQTPLVVYGMSQFYNRAIFAKVRHGDDFLRFHQLLRDRLKDMGIEIRDEHAVFTPHITIIKLKRPERKLLGSRNIEPSIYFHVKETVFGKQDLCSLHLCTMDGQRRHDGFYVTLHEINLT